MFLADENLVRLDWFISNFVGGIKLNVRIEDVVNARKLLDSPSSKASTYKGLVSTSSRAAQVRIAQRELPGTRQADRLRERVSERSDSDATASLALPRVRG